jgi:hypothetical protein
MHGLIIATYVLRAQQQSARPNEDFLKREARAHAAAHRVLVSLTTGFASLAALAIVLDVLR